MEEIYSQALLLYQQNNLEAALNLVRLCEPSSKVNALTQECTKSLRNQYQMLIDESKGKEVQEYIAKYILLLGCDEYINKVALREYNELSIQQPTQPFYSEINQSEQQANSKITFSDKYGVIIAIIAGLFFLYEIISLYTDIPYPYLYMHLYNIFEGTSLLFLLYVIGTKYLRFTKVYIGIVITGMMMPIIWEIVCWYYRMQVLNDEAINRAIYEGWNYIYNIFSFKNYILISAFFIGIIIAKQIIGKIIFLFLIVYAGIEISSDFQILDFMGLHLQCTIEYALLLFTAMIFVYDKKFRKLRATNQ